jgi:hypothetical protein
MKALVFFGAHRTGHFIGHHGTVPVLKRPHAFKIKKANAVAVTQDMTQVRLETRHGTQLPVDESNPALLGAYPQTSQKIGYSASSRKAYL